MITKFPSAAAVAAVLIFAAACSADGSAGTDDPAVATLQTEADTGVDPAVTSDETDTLEAPDDPELAFALYDECMSEAGFDFGTSIAGVSGDGIVIEDLSPDEIDPQAQAVTGPEEFGETFRAADEACQPHLANLDLSFDLTPEQEAELEDAQLAWAECMRANGIDVPDFDTGSGAIAIEIGPNDDDPQAGAFGGADFDFEAFEEAAGECDGAFDALDAQLGGEDTP